MAAAILSPRPRSSLPLNIPFLENLQTPWAPSTTTVQRWDGNERTATEWNALRRDNELWLEDGRCYVYLYRPGQSQRGPSFRIPYELIVKANCHDLLDRHLISTWNSSPYSPSCPGGECYLYLHAPANLSREEAFEYHLDTRNFFAWIVGVPLVGADPITALVRLKDRMDAWRDHPADNVSALVEYIKTQGYCDVPTTTERPFSQKVVAPTTPSRRFDSLKRMFRLSTPAYGKRMSEMMLGAGSRRPVTAMFSAIGGRSEAARTSCHEIVSQEQDSQTQERRASNASSTSEYSSAPSLGHSRDDSTSSLASSYGSQHSTSPITPRTPDIPDRSSSFGQTMKQGKEYALSEDLPKERADSPQEVVIDSLIAELRRGTNE